MAFVTVSTINASTEELCGAHSTYFRQKLFTSYCFFIYRPTSQLAYFLSYLIYLSHPNLVPPCTKYCANTLKMYVRYTNSAQKCQKMIRPFFCEYFVELCICIIQNVFNNVQIKEKKVYLR